MHLTPEFVAILGLAAAVIYTVLLYGAMREGGRREAYWRQEACRYRQERDEALRRLRRRPIPVRTRPVRRGFPDGTLPTPPAPDPRSTPPLLPLDDLHFEPTRQLFIIPAPKVPA